MAIEITSSAKPATPWKGLSLTTTSKIGVAERMLLTERLALLLETGVPLHAALKTLREQTVNPQFADIVQAILRDVLDGKPFSAALARHPRVFSGAYVNLIAASENGGFMHKVLNELVAMDEKQEKLRRTLISAASYPVFLIVFSFAVVVFVLVAVFPKFAEMFASIRDQLPWTTLVLMTISDILRQYWLSIIGVPGAGVFVFLTWLKKPHAAAAFDRLAFKLPVVKDIFIQIYLTRALRVMGVSLANGVSALNTIQDCKLVVSNVEFQAFMQKVHDRVSEGGGFAAAFRETEFIPAIVRQMIATGEETGNLAKVMERVADFYERELTKKIATLSKLAEPVMLLMMGVIVGVIVSSLILPIFKLSQAVH